MVDFRTIIMGRDYDRPELAKIWGYRTIHPISRGVVTPKDSHIIILFVTKYKQNSSIQYNDYIDEDYLYWEGEKGHSNDNRIIEAKRNGDEIHLFYRDKHHNNFFYKGLVELEDFTIYTKKPSEFKFKLIYNNEVERELEDLKCQYQALSNTERESIVKSRIGQGIFRQKLKEYWGGCAVTELNMFELLKASHIKPWRDSDNDERLDVYNGLLLIPQLDVLFDRGYITFKDNGDIVISSVIHEKNYKLLSISERMKLKTIESNHVKYLQYHRDHIFVK